MSQILDDLYQVLLTRKGAAADASYVASLYHGGVDKMAEKIMEEAGELIDEARADDQARMREECADLLFHVLVLMADKNVPIADVLQVLEGRFGTSGHVEKASRDS